jgi:hypothetical protein
MQYVSRPICTITDYLTFLHGGRSIAALREKNTSTGQLPQVEDGDSRYGKVVYYARIKRLQAGPGERPVPAQLGVTTATDGTVSAFEGEAIGAETAAQTRADWDSALIAYRSEMYSRKGPQE